LRMISGNENRGFSEEGVEPPADIEQISKMRIDFLECGEGAGGTLSVTIEIVVGKVSQIEVPPKISFGHLEQDFGGAVILESKPMKGTSGYRKIVLVTSRTASHEISQAEQVGTHRQFMPWHTWEHSKKPGNIDRMLFTASENQVIDTRGPLSRGFDFFEESLRRQ